METKEISDITISWVALSIAFMFLFEGVRIPAIYSLLMYLFIVAVSFLSHELGHRQMARRYGFRANYEMWPFGVALAILTSMVGFLFAAPGAVVIRPGKGAFMGGRKKLNEIGLKISISGILINIAFGVVFALFALYLGSGSVFYETLRIASGINIWLAIFNLLPIQPLDGSKVLYYNKGVWIATFALSVILYFSLRGLF